MNRVHIIVSFHAVCLCVVDFFEKVLEDWYYKLEFVCCIDLGDFYVWERCIWVLEFR